MRAEVEDPCKTNGRAFSKLRFVPVSGRVLLSFWLLRRVAYGAGARFRARTKVRTAEGLFQRLR
jgi:hypothetical protein